MVRNIGIWWVRGKKYDGFYPLFCIPIVNRELFIRESHFVLSSAFECFGVRFSTFRREIHHPNAIRGKIKHKGLFLSNVMIFNLFPVNNDK